jgi:hypothetical protein
VYSASEDGIFVWKFIGNIDNSKEEQALREATDYNKLNA